MEKRVLLFIFLTFLVLYGYQALFVPPPVTPERPEAAPAEVAVEPPAPALPADAVTAPASPTVIGETSERDIRLETADLVAVFTNRGARLKSWRLKHYFDANGEPLELVATELAEAYPLPFSLVTEDPAVTRTLNAALFAVQSPQPVGVQTSTATVRFDYQDEAGLRVSKTFRVGPSSYLIALEWSASLGSQPLAPAIAWGPAVGNPQVRTTQWARAPGGLLYRDGELERYSAGDIGEQPEQRGAHEYAGVEDHYFLTAAIHPGESAVTYQRVPAPAIEGASEQPVDLVMWTIGGDTLSSPLTVFAGPKDIDVLAAVDPNLVRAIDFGIFAVIVVPLLRTLNWLHGFVGNYGWSIVLLTIIINAVMFPLRHKSVVSMRKMQEIQPEAKAIQERYAKLKATDPAKQKMNQELMALYRERGVNPAGGCLPMLLTFPVLFAFYSLLTVAIELRGAPFFGWIQDLSAPDPYFVTPVLMGASQMWQTWLTPQAGVDPTQQKIMRLMPVIFMVFMLWLPAGVTLYWLVSNLWSIGQTYLTNYLIGPPIVRTVRPAAERRVKRAGGGPADQAAGEN